MQPSDEELSIFCFNIDNSVSSIVEWGPYKIGYFLARAKDKDKDKPNEDALFIINNDKELLFGISDGAGGHPKGAEASLLACDSVKTSFFNTDERKQVLELIFDANKQVVDMKVGAKCTLCLGLLSYENIQAFSVGDSEIIGWNHLGSELYSNIPDSNVGHSIEAGHVSQEDSLNDPQRYIVNNMIGDETIRVEVTSKISTKRGHTYLLGSDGLFDNFSHKDLYSFIGEGAFEESFNNLVKLCESQDVERFHKIDDISFVVIRKVRGIKGT